MHFYLKKGIAPDKILALTPLEKMFYTASAQLEIEQENEKYKALFGSKRR